MFNKPRYKLSKINIDFFYSHSVVGYDIPDLKSKRATSFGYGDRAVADTISK